MIIMHGVSNGVTLGATLVQGKGKDFNCGEACWPIGEENERTFVALQNMINRFATSLGFKLLVVDSYIGPSTVAAAQKIVASIRTLGNAADYAMRTASKESLAANAPFLLEAFAKVAAARNLPAVKAPTAAPAKKPPAVPVAEEERYMYDERGSNWFWWALGAVAVVSIGTVGYLTYKRRKEQEVGRYY